PTNTESGHYNNTREQKRLNLPSIKYKRFKLTYKKTDEHGIIHVHLYESPFDESTAITSPSHAKLLHNVLFFPVNGYLLLLTLPLLLHLFSVILVSSLLISSVLIA